MESAASGNGLASPASHSLHECHTEEEFRARFRAAVGFSAESAADAIIAPETPKAIFLVGSIPLGVATSGSDVDFVVVVDDKTSLSPRSSGIANSEQRIAFTNEGNSLVAGRFATSIGGVTVEVQVVVAPALCGVLKRLRNRGPELDESEIMILGRLGTGWLLWESPRYLERSGVILADPAFNVYCCTVHFVKALQLRRKAINAMELSDIPLVLHLGRLSVEAGYLAYFASEGFSYLGARWLAHLGYGRGARERLIRQPLLQQGIPLLFPQHASSLEEAGHYLQMTSDFLRSMRRLIETKTLFRIAFLTCPQINPI